MDSQLRSHAASAALAVVVVLVAGVVAAGVRAGRGHADPARGPRDEPAPPATTAATGPALAGVVVAERSLDGGAPSASYAYEMPNAMGAFAWPDGAGDSRVDLAPGGLSSGVGLIAVPRLVRGRVPEDGSTRIAVANVAHRPGFTDFVLYISGPRRLEDYICTKLNEDQHELLGGFSWVYLSPGFAGSALISATFWEHDVFAADGSWVRNGLGLAAVAEEWGAGFSGRDDASAVVAPPVYLGDWTERATYDQPLCPSGSSRPPRPTRPSDPTATPTPSPTPTVPQPTLPPITAPYPPESPPVYLAALGLGPQGECAATVTIQNVGSRRGQAVVLVWPRANGCAACSGPTAALCSPVLEPGTSWELGPAALPRGAASGVVYSFDAAALAELAPDTSCPFTQLFAAVVGTCAGYADFHNAYRQRGTLDGVSLAAVMGPMLAATVQRDCAVGASHALDAYTGASGPALGGHDATGRYGYSLPAAVSSTASRTDGSSPADSAGTLVHVQNAGGECATVELWVQDRGSCAPRLHDTFDVAPGGAAVRALSATSDTTTAAVWSSQPAAVTVDMAAGTTLSSYGAPPRVIVDAYGRSLFDAPDSVLFAPVVYGHYAGWSSVLHVQNTSSDTAQMLVTFLDRNGDVAAAHQVGPICAGGGFAMNVGELADVPWCWAGWVRVEGLPADAPQVAPPWSGPEPTPIPPPSLGAGCGVPTPGPSPTAGPGSTASATPRPQPTATPQRSEAHSAFLPGAMNRP